MALAGLSLDEWKAQLDVAFERGVGHFYADDQLDSRPIRVRFTWLIGDDGHPRWESADVMIANLSAILHEGRTSAHHSHSPEITFESPTKAKGIWGMEDYIFDSASGELPIHGFGFYHETYERIGGRWYIKTVALTRLKMDLW